MNKKLFSKETIFAIIDWIIKMVGYALILFVTSLVFDDTLFIDKNLYGLWFLLAAIIIYLLNITIKPLLVWLTIPITGITLGLFYPFINLIVLKIVNVILGPHFHIYGIWYAVCAAVLISALNVLMDTFILDKIKRKGKPHESHA